MQVSSLVRLHRDVIPPHPPSFTFSKEHIIHLSASREELYFPAEQEALNILKYPVLMQTQSSGAGWESLASHPCFLLSGVPELRGQRGEKYDDILCMPFLWTLDELSIGSGSHSIGHACLGKSTQGVWHHSSKCYDCCILRENIVDLKSSGICSSF